MKAKFAIATSATILLAAALSGCATPANFQEQERHRQHHPEADMPRGGAGMGGGMGMMGEGMGMGGRGMMMSDADTKSMCDMHEKMMQGKTPEERKAIMAEHMKKMSPQMRQRHMELMQSQMQMMQEYMKDQPPGK